MTDAVAAARRYRFAPLDRSGVILGLDLVQCVLCGLGLLTSAFLVRVVAIPVAAGPLVAAGAVAFGRVGGRPVREWVPVMFDWHLLGAQRPWCVPIGLLGPDTDAVPPFLAGLELLEVDAPDWVARARVGAVGVVHDPKAHTMTLALRVAGRAFSLAEPAEQDRLVSAWGDAIAVFSRERSPVSRVAWCEFQAPAGVEEHVEYVHAQSGTHAIGRADYLALVDSARGFTSRHEVLVSLTVDQRRARAARGDTSRTDALCAVLLEESRLFVQRLGEAGLQVDAPLTPEMFVRALRERMDPATLVAGAAHFQPVATVPDYRHVQVDGSLHRAYWIGDWPRLEQPADWMTPLLLHAGGTRSVAMVYEPVSVARSARAVTRDAVKLQADEEQRRRGGWRVGAVQRRAHREVAEREAELVAGYSELRYTGFVVVAAPDPATLDERAAEVEQIGARVGLDLRALYAQHDVGLGAALPIGRYPSATWRP